MRIQSLLAGLRSDFRRLRRADFDVIGALVAALTPGMLPPVAASPVLARR